MATAMSTFGIRGLIFLKTTMITTALIPYSNVGRWVNSMAAWATRSIVS